MSITTIKDLYDEMLIEVFEKLDKVSLLNCTLVCKKWKNEIYDSTSLMNQFTLKIEWDWTSDSEENLKEVLSIKRKVLNLQFINVDRSGDIYKILKVHQKLLRSLKFNDCNLSDNPMKKIGHELKNLRSVKIKDSSLNILDSLSGVELSSFEVIRICDSTTDELYILKNFISSQRKLVTIKINFDETIRDLLLLNLTVQVKHLSITTGFMTDDEFNQFIRNYASVVESLEIKCIISPKSIKLLLKELKFLKSLTLNPSNMINFENWNIRFDIISNLRHLKIVDHRLDEKFAMQLLESLPKLESLTFDIPTENILEFIGRKLINLRILKLKNFSFSLNPERIFSESNFSNLREFHCQCISFSKTDFFWDLVHPTNEINENHYKSCKDNLLKALAQNKSIRHIKVGGDLNSIKEFLEAARNMKPRSLESMELIVKKFRYSKSITKSFFYIWDTTKVIGISKFQH